MIARTPTIVSTTAPALGPPESAMDNMEPLFALVRSTNPFVDNRVTDLFGDGVDVNGIHSAAFERLIALAREALQLRRGLGVVLWGEAGIGKSHLLSRLARWVAHDQQACAVYLHNLQASPGNLPRSLLKSVVSILTRGQVHSFAETPLYGLAFALVREAMNQDTGVCLWSVVDRAYSKLVDRLSSEDLSRPALVDRTVYNVLLRFVHSAYRAEKTGDEEVARLAVRWLSGDYLDPEEARRLRLPPGPSQDAAIALADNQLIKQVLVALSRMALSRKQPFLLCFDQVDNLDDDQAAALSRFLEALIDSAPNLLVVTAGIQATLLRWRETLFQESAWHRIAQFEVRLQRLTPAEGSRIVAARLESAITPLVEWEPVRLLVLHDYLFPLGQPWAQEFFRDKIDVRPRDVMNGAREAWRCEQEALARRSGAAWLETWPHSDATIPLPPLTEEQLKKAIDSKVEQRIEEIRSQLRTRPEVLPADASNLARLVATLLEQVGDREIIRPPAGEPDREFPYSLVVRLRQDGAAREPRTAFRFLATNSATSTAAALRWLTNAENCPQRLLLVTDELLPLALGAQSDSRARQYFAELRDRNDTRFQPVELTFKQYAELHALQAVVGMARAGDLEIDLPGGNARQISENEVIESHRRQRRYSASSLLSDLVDDSTSETRE